MSTAESQLPPFVPWSFDRWAETCHGESAAAEARVNLIQLAALPGFCAHHLLDVFLLRDDGMLAERYHTELMAIAQALFCPASNDGLDTDTLLRMAFALLLLMVCDLLLWLRRKPARARVASGAFGAAATTFMVTILLLAIAVSLVVSILKVPV
jgi:hypothetical protein